MRDETPTMRLASRLLQEPVLPWIRQRREAGKSWQAIAEELKTLTSGDIDVPRQTLVAWVERDDRRPAAIVAESA